MARPAISHPVHVLSHAFPKTDPQEFCNEVLIYVKSTIGLGLLMSSNSKIEPETYCDSDLVSCPKKQKSLTGYYTKLGESLISSKTKKHSTVLRLHQNQHKKQQPRLYVRSFRFEDYLKTLELIKHSLLHCFVKTKHLHIAANQVYHKRILHLETDCHLIREKLYQGINSVCISTHKTTC